MNRLRFCFIRFKGWSFILIETLLKMFLLIALLFYQIQKDFVNESFILALEFFNFDFYHWAFVLYGLVFMSAYCSMNVQAYCLSRCKK